MDDNISETDMSEWASEDEPQEKRRPVFKSKTDEKEWERKERNREYRVAARREKRLRKADEKKQRKLNATLLRRMTKNPEKYTKNADRNREREIQLERRRIYREAVAQAERLAAVHDPSGKTFNVGPVVLQDDGVVISIALLERRAKIQAEKVARLAEGGDNSDVKSSSTEIGLDTTGVAPGADELPQNGINPARRQLIELAPDSTSMAKHLSKTQQKKLAVLEDIAPPPRPIIPVGVSLPDGEEDWVSLWDLSKDDLERRVNQEKKRKAAERKALRIKQKEGKVERRAARDERRKVYREKKLEWKAIKEAELTQRKALLRVEQEEAKKIEVEVNLAERRQAMEACARLGFTLENTEGVADIKPRALGMKGREIDFDMLEIGDRPSMLKLKDGKLLGPNVAAKGKKSHRVDLGQVADESKLSHFTSDTEEGPNGLEGDFVALDVNGAKMDPQQFGEANYNHKLRRKLHRAIEAALIKKEIYVRAKTVEHCEQNGIEVPVELQKEYQPLKLHGRRVLENGQVETEKQERVRKRVELAEYNRAAKVLRQQAKAAAVEAGLRKFAELTGQTSFVDSPIPVADGANSVDNVNPPIEEEQNVTSERPKKRRRNSEDQDTKRTKKSKKDGHAVSPSDEITNTHSNNQEGVPKPKTKKRKSSHDRVDSTDLVNDEEAASKERKRLRKEKKLMAGSSVDVALVEPNTLAEIASESMDETNIKRAKKSKKSKSKHDQTEIAIQPENEVHSRKALGASGEEVRIVGTADQWNPEALDGDVARKSKFLRLLGAGKGSSLDTSGRKAKAPEDLSSMKRVENELVQQFDAGIKMKHDGQGKRRGLGA